MKNDPIKLMMHKKNLDLEERPLNLLDGWDGYFGQGMTQIYSTYELCIVFLDESLKNFQLFVWM